MTTLRLAFIQAGEPGFKSCIFLTALSLIAFASSLFIFVRVCLTLPEVVAFAVVFSFIILPIAVTLEALFAVTDLTLASLAKAAL